MERIIWNDNTDVGRKFVILLYYIYIYIERHGLAVLHMMTEERDNFEIKLTGICCFCYQRSAILKVCFIQCSSHLFVVLNQIIIAAYSVCAHSVFFFLLFCTFMLCSCLSFKYICEITLE